MAGGVTGGKKLQAVLFGGAAGAFATSAHLDVRLTFEDLRAAGLPLGSGVVMVFDETRDLRAAFDRLGHFFAHESCGKCYPCQMGSQRQAEILHRMAAGEMLAGDLERLQDVGWTMTDASLCGLGQTAAGAILSAIQLWPGMFVENGKGRVAIRSKAKSPVRAKKAETVKKKAVKAVVKKTKPKLKPKPAKNTRTRPAAKKTKAGRKSVKR
jgi:NADH-quinone oxidoreductase subunit F